MDIYETCVQQFRTKSKQSKHIGLEVEIPIVNCTGEAVSYSLIHKMYLYLQDAGFELHKEKEFYIEASFHVASSQQYKYIVTTDLGYSTLEIILPPFADLHIVYQAFQSVLHLLLSFFNKKRCRLLGYGIHPVALPSRFLVTPRQRYQGLEKIWTTNRLVPKSMGNDSHLLTLSAANQCHIDLREEEAIQAMNVLNASSGLQIALQANAPIWKSKIDNNYKSVREAFYDVLFPDSDDRHGIVFKFDTLGEYFRYIAELRLFLVPRNGQLLQICGYSFEEYLSKTTVEATNLNGEKVLINPALEDIHYHNTFCYLNARLVPKYGTIEVRMPCQQPPGDTMVTAALNLGLIENLNEASIFFDQYDWNFWTNLRTEAVKYALQAKLSGGESILPLVRRMLQIAQKGLLKRNLGEAIFLKPLFERLEQCQSPADRAIAIFKQKGMEAFLNNYSFKFEKT